MSLSEDVPHQLKITRGFVHSGDIGRPGNRGQPQIYLSSNNRTLAFSASMWSELTRMISDFNATGAPVMSNYEEHLPVRTPLHANVPLKPSLEDII